MFRTSHTHPLHIATLNVGTSGGAIGITFAPGKYQESAMTGAWNRDLELDLRAIREWGATYLVSLLEPWEFDELRIAALPKRAAALGLRWFGLPIVDGAGPADAFLDEWRKVGPALCERILCGGRAIVHCKGGLGRAGTVACLLLLDTGAAKSAEHAMHMVRQVRPGAIETHEQEQFIRGWSKPGTSHGIG